MTKATDIVDQLMARAALRKAMMLDPDAYEQAFIEHGQGVGRRTTASLARSSRRWASAPTSSQAAGFYGKCARPRLEGARKAEAACSSPTGIGEVRRLEAGILALTEPFSVRDVSEKVGGSTITVTKAIERLEAQKKIVSAGERANERGRASRMWAVAAS